MAKYTEEQKRKLHKVQILEIMAHYGKRLDHTRSELYYSPFRDEDEPSFHIDSQRNTWYDYGTGEGGSLFDFVCKFADITRGEVYDWLAGFRGVAPEGKYIDAILEVVSSARSTGVPKIVIDSVSNQFTKSVLVEYAAERQVSREVLENFCEEVFYHIDGRSGKFYAIGFKNNSGGYVLRSGLKNGKRCTSSDLTTLGPNGIMTTEVCSDKVVVFEGFMDFLSWLTHAERKVPGYDCCILNSVTNIKKALPWIASHHSIAAFMDNDEAGKNTLSKILEGVPSNCEVIDMSKLYEGYNDLNEMLMSENL